MLLTHVGRAPRIDPTATVASTATVVGDVTVGPGSRILHGAVLVAEGGAITLGRECIVMENAVIRATARHACAIGNHCLIGPSAHVVGCTLEDQVFIASGATVFHAARLGKGCEVRVHGVVHLRTVLPPGETVPIGWVAVGDPVQVLPPEAHEKIWAVQRALDFPGTVYGVARGPTAMVDITRRLSRELAAHGEDGPPSGAV